MNAVDQAAAGGHFEIVKFLLENRSEGCTTKAADEAAAIGHLEIITYILASKRGNCTALAMNKASARGHVHVVCWLHNNRSEDWSPETINETRTEAICSHPRMW